MEAHQSNLTEFVDEMADKTNEYGHVDEDSRVEVEVQYETDNGNVKCRQGEVWMVEDGLMRFSENAGEVNEDPYFVESRYGKAMLVSVSENGKETDLGDVVDFYVFREEGDNAEAERQIDAAIQSLEAAKEATNDTDLQESLEARIDELHKDAMLASGLNHIQGSAQ